MLGTRLRVESLVLFCVKSGFILYPLLPPSVFPIFLVAVDFIHMAFFSNTRNRIVMSISEGVGLFVSFSFDLLKQENIKPYPNPNPLRRGISSSLY